MKKGFGPWLASVALVFALLRIPFLSVPLDRDEGEYATMAASLLRGNPPYSETCDTEFPGTTFLYAIAIKVFGPSVSALHITLLLVNLGCIFLVGRMGKMLLGPREGLVGAAIYGTLTLGTGMFGYWLCAEHFANLILLMAGILFIRGIPVHHPIQVPLGSLLLGCAIILKQHAAIPALGWLAAAAWHLPRAGKPTQFSTWLGFLIPVLLPFLVLVLFLGYVGTLDRFFFWTWEYARIHATRIPFLLGLEHLHVGAMQVVEDAPVIWLGALAGFCLLLSRWFSPIGREGVLWMVPVVLASLLAVCPGLLFRGQYFILTAPSAALLVAMAWQRIGQTRFGKVLSTAVLAACFLPLVHSALIACQMSPVAVSRMVYGLNPFPESQEVADYIRKHTQPEERVAVLGSEAQIYFLSGRAPATSYIFVYDLMKAQPYARGMQKEMMAQLEKNQPAYVVVANIPTSWGMHPESDRTLLNWANGWLRAHYQLDGVVDLISETSTVIRWGDEAGKYRPESEFLLKIYKKTKS